MEIIRAFENMLNEVKLRGNYQGIEYNHRGPAHLSIGQEAAAVGQAYLLGVDDHIYGSTAATARSSPRASRPSHKLDDEALHEDHEGLLRRRHACASSRRTPPGPRQGPGHRFPDLRRAGRDLRPRDSASTRAWAARCTPSSRPSASCPTTPSSAARATSPSARPSSSTSTSKPGIVICNIGDASAGCGPVWEGICFATMDQFKKLWDEAHRGGLPLILNFVNNFYGMGGQPVGETMGFKVLARLGAGVNPEQMHAERVDGYNPLAVIDAIAPQEGDPRGEATARSCSTPSPTASPATRPPTPPATARRAEVEAWQQHGLARRLRRRNWSTPRSARQAEIDADPRSRSKR